MGLLSHKISRDEVKPGDHIYSWRKAFTYAHHGIYVGDGRVIHFTSADRRETKTGISASSSSNHGVSPCPTCGSQSQLDGPRSSCLDCFLAGGNLYLFKYSTSRVAHLVKLRGECTKVPSDPPEEVLRRANYLLHNGFGGYNIVTNNCEHFAFYCKTGLAWHSLNGMSNQVYTVLNTGFHVSIGVVGAVTLHSALVLPIAAVPLFLMWNRARVKLDRSLINRFYHKVPVEELVSQNNAGTSSCATCC